VPSFVGLWLSRESVGDAGVNHLGYYTGVWSPTGDAIAAHGFTGALHVWNRDGNGALVPCRAVGGHFGPVVDAAWGVDGGCLLTVSTDQTARLTTRIAPPGSSSRKSEWCEVARPQVHGHDFSCVAALPCRGSDGSHAYIYASGSEEKVIRVFQAPRAFSDTLDFARGRKKEDPGRSVEGPPTPDWAYGATLPALGLSNKAFYSAEEAGREDTARSGGVPLGGDYYDEGPDFAPSCAPSSVAGRPLEEHLAQNTLWPEIHKLYGHGNEVHCVAADPRGLVLASACRAQTASAAAIRLWDVSTWSACPGGELHAHMLTVTQLAFSPDGEFLASASRDRSIAVFRRQGPTSFDLGCVVQKSHARIVWGLSWSHDSRLLATASRDGTVKVWTLGQDSSLAEATVIRMGESVQSVAFGPMIGADSTAGLFACGLEGGDVILGILSWKYNSCNCDVAWSEVWRTSAFERHAEAVRRLCWGQGSREISDAQSNFYDLASCSDDHGIRIYTVVV
jgi:elongator complex protein 2